MERPDYLPVDLDSETIKWLKVYGYCLNYNSYTRVKEGLKKWYIYEYYFYVDLEIREEACKIFEGEEPTKEFYRNWDKRFRNEKKRIIKALYGLEKKGIN